MADLAIPIPEIDDITLVFPARALDWMPPMEAIPDEFKNMNRGTEWNEIAHAWFAVGLSDKVKFYPREGVDPEKAVRAIKATLGSYAPKHEHKEAAAAYMLATWFKKVKKWRR